MAPDSRSGLRYLSERPGEFPERSLRAARKPPKTRSSKTLLALAPPHCPHKKHKLSLHTRYEFGHAGTFASRIVSASTDETNATSSLFSGSLTATQQNDTENSYDRRDAVRHSQRRLQHLLDAHNEAQEDAGHRRLDPRRGRAGRAVRRTPSEHGRSLSTLSQSLLTPQKKIPGMQRKYPGMRECPHDHPRDRELAPWACR